MKKITKTSLISVGAMAVTIPTIASVVSCNNEDGTSFWNKIGSVANNLFTNESGSLITASQFVDEAKESGILTVLNKYTNYSSVDNQVDKVGGIMKPRSIYNVSQETGNSVFVLFEIEEKSSNKKEEIELVINGFDTDWKWINRKLDEVTSNFQTTTTLTAKNISNYKTSEDIWNQWYKSQSTNRLTVLSENVDGIPKSIIESSTYEGIKVEFCPTGSITEEEAKEYIWWLDEENQTTNDTKGTSLFIKFKFIITSNTVPEGISRDIVLEVKGFPSFKTKFNSLKQDFVNNNGYLKVKDSSSTPISIRNQYDAALTQDAKLDVLKKYIDIPTDSTLSNGLSWNILSVKEGTRNDAILEVNFSISWNGITENVTISLSPFMTTNEYVNSIKQKFEDMKLFATNQGRTFTSEEVYNQYLASPESIYENVGGWLTPDSDSVVLKIGNVYWNSDDSIQERGTTLFINVIFTYNNVEYPISNAKEIVDFVSPFKVTLIEFNKVVDAISLSLKLDKVNKHIISEVNTNNWREWIDGIPTENSKYSISSLTLDINDTNGNKGILPIQFVYSWEAEYKGKSIGTTLNSVIKQDVGGFITYKEKADENFKLINAEFVGLGNNNYLDKNIKDGLKKSDFLTSFFAVDSTIDGLNSNLFLNNFKKLFNIPDNMFGIKFEVVELKYSNTDSSLLHTQMKVKYVISNIYDSSNSIQKTEVLSGFLDPFNDEVRRIKNLKEWDWYNNRDQYSEYGQVPSEIRMGGANWQTSWGVEGVSWGWNEYPQAYFSGNTNKWLGWATNNVPKIINYNFGSKHYDLAYTLSYKDAGSKRTKSKDSLVALPVGIKFTFTATIKDKFGNESKGRYNNIVSKNLLLWTFWKDKFWK